MKIKPKQLTRGQIRKICTKYSKDCTKCPFHDNKHNLGDKTYQWCPPVLMDVPPINEQEVAICREREYDINPDDLK